MCRVIRRKRKRKRIVPIAWCFVETTDVAKLRAQNVRVLWNFYETCRVQFEEACLVFEFEKVAENKKLCHALFIVFGRVGIHSEDCISRRWRCVLF